MESSGNVSGTNVESDSKTDKVVSPSPSDQNNHVPATENPRSPTHSSAGATQLDNSPGTSTSNNAGIRTEEEMPVSSMPKSGDGSAMVTSPTQAADQQPSVASSPSPNSSRIPSYVFARNKSSGNMEWSVASNESLFSIHMGNASFTTDQMSWMSKSGELGYTFDPTFSGPLMDLPVSCQTPTRLSTEQAIAKKSGNLNEGYGATEAAAAETMREVLREKEAEAKANTAKESAHSRNLSHTSDSSIKSFAFPILTGDSNRSCSFRPSNTKAKKLLSRVSTPKQGQQSPSETPKTQTPKAQTPQNGTGNAGIKRWFSCIFPCCPSCS